MSDNNTYNHNVVQFPSSTDVEKTEDTLGGLWTTKDFSKSNLDRSMGLIERDRQPQMIASILLSTLTDCMDDVTNLLEDCIGLERPETDEHEFLARGALVKMILGGKLGELLEQAQEHGYEIDPINIDSLFYACDRIVTSVALIKYLEVASDAEVSFALSAAYGDLDIDRSGMQ